MAAVGKSSDAGSARSGAPTCRRCGYELAGLPQGGRCPECGAGIPVISSKLVIDNVSRAPVSFLRWLAFGSACCVLGGFLGTGLFFAAPSRGRLQIATVATFLIWYVGVWILSKPHRSSVDTRTDFVREGWWSRWLSRGTQWGWAACVALLFASAEVEYTALATMAPVDKELVRGLAMGGWACAAFALLGLIPFCLQLASLGEWGGHEWVGEWCRGASIGLVVSPPLILGALASGGANFVLTIAGALAAAVFVGSGCILAIGVFQIASMSYWALVASAKSMDADRRLNDERNETLRKMAERSGPTASPAHSQRPTQPDDLSPIALPPSPRAGPRTIRHDRPPTLDDPPPPKPAGDDSYTVL